MELKLSTAYHPQTDGQIEVVNKCLGTYMRCVSGEKPTKWSHYLALTEWWYNTNFHFRAQTIPFEILYGYSPPIHLPYIPGDSRNATVDIMLKDRKGAIKMLKFHLQGAHNRMKSNADKKRSGMIAKLYLNHNLMNK